MTSSGSDVWGEGIAASGNTLHLIFGTSEIRYRRSSDEGATWSADALIGSGVLHLTDPIVADGNDVWVVYLDNITNVSDWCCVPATFGAVTASWSRPALGTLRRTA